MRFNIFAAGRLALAFWLLAAVMPALAQDKPASPPVATLSENLSRTQDYLRKELGNAAIVLTLKDAKTASVMVGSRPAGTLEFEFDTFDWQLSVPLSELSESGAIDPKKAEAYLKALLGSKTIGVKPKDESNAGVTITDQIGGTLTVDKLVGTASFDIVFFEDDLPKLAGAGGGPAAASPKSAVAVGTIEPVDAANATYYARVAKVKVFDEADASGAPSASLSLGQKINVTGKLKMSNGDIWYRLDFADGKPRFVASEDLLTADEQARRQRYTSLTHNFPLLLSQIGASAGDLAPFMGFYTLGTECKLAPVQIPLVAGFKGAQRTGQQVQDIFWSMTSWALWSDGTYLFRANVDSGKPDRFRPTFVRKVKFAQQGEVQIWRMERIEPAGFDPDMSIVGFTATGRLLLSVQIDGTNYKWNNATRCTNNSAAKDATKRYYQVWLGRLAGEVVEPFKLPKPVPQRVDPAGNTKFFVRLPDIVLRSGPTESSKEVAKLEENEEVKLIEVQPVDGVIDWNEGRWWQVENKAGVKGYVLGKQLMSEDAFKTKKKLIGHIGELSSALGKPRLASGANTRLAGIFSLMTCESEPAPKKQKNVSPVTENLTNRMQLGDNNRWLSSFEYLWIDKDLLYRTDLTDPGVIRKYRMSPLKTAKYNGTVTNTGKSFYVGQVKFFKLTHLDGPDDHADDWKAIGFNDERHLFKGATFEGGNVRFKFRPRCNMVLDIEKAANATYVENVHLLQMTEQPIKFLE